MSQDNVDPRVIPAQLDFLAIYNPTLGTSDETLKDQLVYYYARRNRRRDRNQKDGTKTTEEEENERLRQIGLAQGMVNFAKTFSNSNVDTIDTERSRIVLHELEKDWWILASIDLTRLPAARTTSHDDNVKSGVEYSAREVAPAPLLVAQLARANSLFLLHHAIRLTELFERAGRNLFCGLLDRYWSKFVSGWDVLLHGSPATTIYNATRLSGGGELGIGVGEEECGSGEREVLEGFMERTEGLRDLVVGRYGLPPETERPVDMKEKDTWLGTGSDPVAADGLIFSGRGLISRRSLSTISQWMEAIFKHGDDAYGIGENPGSRPRHRRKRQAVTRSTSDESQSNKLGAHSSLRTPRTRAPHLRKQAMKNNTGPPGIPAPLVGQVERSLNQALEGASKKESDEAVSHNEAQKPAHSTDGASDDTSMFGSENVLKYLTLGYGTSWTLNPKGWKGEKSTVGSQTKSETAAIAGEEPRLQEVDPTPEVSEDEKPFRQKLEQSIGKFLIGLSGDLEQTELDEDGEDGSDDETPHKPTQRLYVRTLMVEMARPNQGKRNPAVRANSYESGKSNRSQASAGSSKAPVPKTSAAASVDGSQPNVTHEKVQIAVYVHQPFMFVFLFELHTPSLTMPSFYRSIHNQLGPLQKPLLRSTDPSRIAERIADAMGEKSTNSANTTHQAGNPIYDLVYDPTRMTVRTSIPNIPVPGSLAAEGLTSHASSLLSLSGSWYTLGIPLGTSSTTNQLGTPTDKLVKSAWSRTEALNAHTQILNTYIATRTGTEIEHTVKTARGWWVLWLKIPPSQAEINKQKNTTSNSDEDDGKNIPVTSGANAKVPTYKEAFLVRKAADFNPRSLTTTQSRNMSSGPGRWLLREQKRETSGVSSGGGGASAKGVSDGVGVDARRWVDGLLTLTQ